MPTLKEYNVKLVRLRSTAKMTRTMKMVAANKLRRAQEAVRTAGDFQRRVLAALTQLGGADRLPEHPLLLARAPVKSVLVLLIASDRGLCGGFNHAVNRHAAAWVDARAAAGVRVRMAFCGRRGFLFFRGRAEVSASYEGLAAKPTFAGAARLSRQLLRTVLSGGCDEIYVVGNRPRGPLSQEVAVERLLPLQLPASVPAAPAGGAGMEPLAEPSPAGLAEHLLERVASLRVFLALLNSAAAEHAARMAAMENSSSNADSLIERYTLQRNRARQAAVTRELLEIVAGAEALR